MSTPKYLNARLNRRNWVTLAVSTLSGCGGGMGTDTAGLPGTGGTGASYPGTGGTGIYVQGSISGFGSVILNGIKFDDTQASSSGSIAIDGVTSTSAELRLGMVAGLTGERSATVTTLGTASSIEVWSIARGLISGVANGVFNVSGMTIQTNSNTVFDGINAATPLLSGMSVAVWGLQIGVDGATWIATRVAIDQGTDFVTTGLVNKRGSQFWVNGIQLIGTLATSLMSNTMIRAQGVFTAASASVYVTQLKSLSLVAASLPKGEVEIEGIVTQVIGSNRFMLGNIEVEHSAAYYKPSNFVVTVGARIEAYGVWQNGLLSATEIEFEDEQALHEVEIEATIESFISAANFVLRGQRCDATSATYSNGSAIDLGVNVKVKVKGTKAGDTLMVSELEIEG